MRFADDEIASRIEFDDGTVFTKCDLCRRDYAERMPPGNPPCEPCRVELLEENEDAAIIYLVTRRQYVTAENGRIVDISIPAVKAAMDTYQVRDQWNCLKKVINLFHKMR